MKNKITFVIATAMTFFISTSAFAQLVTSGADDGTDGTLRTEIADTPNGGTITFDASISTINLNSELLINKDLIISGNSSSMTTIDANSNGRIFNITSGLVVLNDLMLVNGLEGDGGAIYITNADVAINNSAITGNIANGASGSGGGIVSTVSVLTILKLSITTGVRGRFCAFTETLPMSSTTLNPSITIPNTGCFDVRGALSKSRKVLLTKLMKN